MYIYIYLSLPWLIPSLTPKFRWKTWKPTSFVGSFVVSLLKLCFTHQSTSSSDHLDFSTEHQSRAGFFTPRIAIAFTALEATKKAPPPWVNQFNIIKLQVDERNPVHVDMYFIPMIYNFWYIPGGDPSDFFHHVFFPSSESPKRALGPCAWRIWSWKITQHQPLVLS